MKRVLLLMTTRTYKARAFLAAAERLGVAVVVGTERPQVSARLHPEAHLDLDYESPADAVRKIVERAAWQPLDAVIATDDEGAEQAAEAARALGLAHNPPEAVAAARDKHLTRQALARAGLPVPWFRLLSTADDPLVVAGEVGYPCVVKPLHLAASRGVIRADDPADLVAAIDRLKAILAGLPHFPPPRLPRSHPTVRRGAAAEPPAGPDGREPRFLVEGFIPGDEVAVEGLLDDGRLRVLAVFDKPDPLDGPFFEETIYVTPSRHPEEVRRRLGETLAAAVEALGLRQGPIHAEARLNDEGVWILEIAPRSIGGLCGECLRFGPDGGERHGGQRGGGERHGGERHGGSVSLEELILRQALGLDASPDRETAAAGVMMVPIPSAGRLEGVDGVDEARRIDGIVDVRMTLAAGQPVAPPPEGSRYLGFLFARGTTAEEAEEALRRAHGRLRVRITPHD